MEKSSSNNNSSSYHNSNSSRCRIRNNYRRCGFAAAHPLSDGGHPIGLIGNGSAAW
jgi:hypothetical protein